MTFLETRQLHNMAMENARENPSVSDSREPIRSRVEEQLV